MITLIAPFRSREQHTLGEKMLSDTRFGFGGHVGTETKERAQTPLGSVRSAAVTICRIDDRVRDHRQRS
jgi:hypothetical protein